MKRPIILDGPEFDWESGADMMSKAVNPDGSPNMGAAMFADPGAMKCPGCSESLWREGTRVKCPHCGHQWCVNSE